MLRVGYIISIFFVTSLLVSCGRADLDVTPNEIVLDEEVQCIEANQTIFNAYQAVDNVHLSDINYGFDHLRSSYSLSVSYMIDHLDVTPSGVNSILTPSIKQEHLSETENGDVVVLNEEQLQKAENLPLVLNELVASITIFQGNEETTITLDDLDVAYPIALKEGSNVIVVDFIAKVDEPVTGAECEESNNEYRSVETAYSYSFTVTRDTKVDFLNSENLKVAVVPDELQTITQLTPKSVDISENLLVIGVTEEASSAQGVFKVTETDFDDMTVVNQDAPNSGAVLVYRKNSVSGDWIFHSFIKSENAEAGDMFGHSVQVEEDIIFVSAPGEDSGFIGNLNTNDSNKEDALISNTSLNSGAIYSYRVDSEDVLFDNFIKPQSVTNNLDSSYLSFGYALVSDDSTLVASDPKKSTFHVYLFNSELQYSHSVTSSYGEPEDGFGYALDLRDNILAVGAPGADFDNAESIGNVINIVNEITNAQELALLDNSLENSGAVFIYGRNNNRFDLYSVLKASNADSEDGFGSSVSLSGCRDEKNTEQQGDVVCALAVGAPFEDGSSDGFNRSMLSNSNQDSGAAYIYEFKNVINEWSEVLYIKSDPAPFNLFGSSVNFNQTALFVSSPFEDSDQLPNKGKLNLYSFDEAASEWSLALEFIDDNTDSVNWGMMSADTKNTLVLSSKTDSGVRFNIAQ